MKRVLGLGNALVDILIQMENDNLLSELGLPKGSMSLIDESEAKRIASMLDGKDVPMASGGSAANTIHGIARLGVSCGFIGKVASDDLGDFFKDDLEKAGINALLTIGKANTGRANTFISTDSERTFATYLGAAVEMTTDEITTKQYENYDIFHVEGYLVYNRDLIEHALKVAKSRNMFISLDLASYNVVEDNLDFLKKVIPQYVDIVFANEEEAKAYTGKAPEDALNEIAEQCKVAVVKIGKEGSYIKAGNSTTKIGIYKTTAIDTTGAGDQYAAGFLYGLNLKLPYKKCGELGALLSSKVIERYGARIPEEEWPMLLSKVGEIID